MLCCRYFRHLCRSLRGSHLPVSSNPPDVMPISKAALVTAFAELAKDSDYGFEQEFEVLFPSVSLMGGNYVRTVYWSSLLGYIDC